MYFLDLTLFDEQVDHPDISLKTTRRCSGVNSKNVHACFYLSLESYYILGTNLVKLHSPLGFLFFFFSTFGFRRDREIKHRVVRLLIGEYSTYSKMKQRNKTV